jgi:hypothetical protein
MKSVPLENVGGATNLSLVLHLSLQALRHSRLQIKAVHLCDMFEVHASELTRMHMLHLRPQYAPLVNEAMLYRLTSHLFRQFPTLVLYERNDGSYKVSLYNRHGEDRLPKSIRDIPVLPPPFKRMIRPGTTKWFLQQEAAQARSEGA